MKLEILNYSPEYKSSLMSFNQRIQSTHKDHFFPIPNDDYLSSKKNKRGPDVYIVTCSNDEVRGAFMVNNFRFCLKSSKDIPVAHLCYPLSEGINDPKYNLVIFKIITFLEKQYEHVFSLGMGDPNNPLPKFQVALGWELSSIPFYFRIVNAKRFLRGLPYLRKTKLHSFGLDLLSYSGIGGLLNSAYQIGVRSTKEFANNCQMTLVNEFDSWADDVWKKSFNEFDFIANRNSESLNKLYPSTDEKCVKIRVEVNNQIVGWAVVLITQMKNDRYFGNLKVATIVDALSDHNYLNSVLYAADSFACQQGADLILSNQSHVNYLNALSRLGYLKSKSNYFFSASKQLKKILNDNEVLKNKIHFTRGDGDGPVHL